MPAFLFPGPGALRRGLGRPWTDHPSWRVVADASDAAGRDLGHLLVNAGYQELAQIGNAQLATLTLSLIVLDALRRQGITPTSCAGHGLGEYSALIAAGALPPADGVKLVAEYTESLEAAAQDHPGGMATVVGLDDEGVDYACRGAPGRVWIAGYNAPGEVVIAGDFASLDAAASQAQVRGARAVLHEPASGAFHTPLMAPARDRLLDALGRVTWADPRVPVVANVDAAVHQARHDWPDLLSAQLTSPIRWHHGLRRLAELDPGERLYVELGPGRALGRLARRVLPTAAVVSVAAPGDLDTVIDAMSAEGAPPVDPYSQSGEHLYVSERIVISPCAGVFQPALGTHLTALPGLIEVGTVIGRTGEQEVRSNFAGRLMGMLALPGERVSTGQRIAWLRAS